MYLVARARETNVAPRTPKYLWIEFKWNLSKNKKKSVTVVPRGIEFRREPP
jgi:hypothetical protein